MTFKYDVVIGVVEEVNAVIRMLSKKLKFSICANTFEEGVGKILGKLVDDGYELESLIVLSVKEK